jgi:hypothetical protein
MPVSSLALWKDAFLTKKYLDLSKFHLGKIIAVGGPKTSITTSFDEISKNPGVALLSLDSSEEKLQLFHHPKVFGDSWSSSEKQLVAILGTDTSAIPVEVVSKLVKDVKLKSHSIEDFALVIDDVNSLATLVNPKTNFHYKNLVPIPNLLIKTFIQLQKKDPLSVTSAFFMAMLQFDTASTQDAGNDVDNLNTTIDNMPLLTDELDSRTSPTDITPPTLITPSKNTKFMDHFVYVLQFCHLCHLGKISPVLYQVS